MPLTVEQQVGVVANLLRSLSYDAWAPQGPLRSALPCSYAELNAWTNRMPDPAVRATLAAALRRIPLIEAAAGFDPMALDGLASLEASDPRVPALLAQLQESWPSSDQVKGILALYECLARTVSGAIKARPQLPKDSALALGLDEAAAKRGTSLDEISSRLSAIHDVFALLRSYQPDRAVPLTVLAVRAPDINFVFSHTGRIVVDDFSAPLAISGTSGAGFLQSRVWPAGEAGTRGEGMIAYWYRIALDGTRGDPEHHGIAQFVVDFGNVAPLDYSGVALEAFQACIRDRCRRTRLSGPPIRRAKREARRFQFLSTSPMRCLIGLRREFLFFRINLPICRAGRDRKGG